MTPCVPLIYWGTDIINSDEIFPIFKHILIWNPLGENGKYSTV